MSANALPPEYPQFYQRSEGSHVWDVDGNEYVDFMCSFGPIILGHQHPKVEAAAAAQRAAGDTQAGPAAAMVEAAEVLVDRVAHADWAVFAKNGTDATTTCVTIARAATGRAKVLAATGAYHGSAPWCTVRMDGVTPEDRANLAYYTFNDIASVHRALEEAGGEAAAIIVSPFRHDAGFDEDLVDPQFARELRALCDRTGAALVLDEVRAGFRLNDGGSWEPLGVAPDLSAWSKAIGNGYPIAAILGSAPFSDAASRIFVTGSFWFQAVPMAAAVATITAIREEGAVAAMQRTGAMLQEGIERQAAEAGVRISMTGPPAMPNLRFPDDADLAKGKTFCGTVAEHGVIIHPRHNWFLSAAHTDRDIERGLDATWAGFQAVRDRFGEG
jgi:glutamate-1-semialdehyde 2,1-aminomutase